MAAVGPPSQTRRSLLTGLLPSLLLNAACPFVLFQILSGRGVPTLTALLTTSVFPLLGIAVGWARSRRLDAIGLLALISIVLGVVTSLISGSVRFYLVKESVITGGFGLVFLGSLLSRRPLIFYFARQTASAGDPALAARFEGLWRRPAFRSGMRLMTVVWGVGLLVEASARVGLALLAKPSVVLVGSPLLAAGAIGGMTVWTVRYGNRMRRRGEQAGSVPPDPPPTPNK